MALTNCKECGNDVSKKAKQCPSCGAPLGPKQYSIGKLIVVVALGFFIYSLFSGGSTPDRNPSSQSANTTQLSVAQKLAVIDHSRNDATAYDRLLDSLTKKCQESRIGVSDVAVRGTQILQEEKSVSLSALEFLQAMDTSIPSDSLNLKCAEIAAALIVLTER